MNRFDRQLVKIPPTAPWERGKRGVRRERSKPTSHIIHLPESGAAPVAVGLAPSNNIPIGRRRAKVSRLLTDQEMNAATVDAACPLVPGITIHELETEGRAIARAQDAKTHRADIEWLEEWCPHHVMTTTRKRFCNTCWEEFRRQDD